MNDADAQPLGLPYADAGDPMSSGVGSAAVHRSVPLAAASCARPVGDLQPSDGRAMRALAALGEKRLADAEKHIAAIAETSLVSRGWKLLLRGLVAIDRAELAVAEPLLLEAAALGFVEHTAADDSGTKTEAPVAKVERKEPGIEKPDCAASDAVPDPSGSDPLPPRVWVNTLAARLAARALHRLGWVYRRQDRVADANAVHRAALRLRERFGSHEELWETAIELGLNADVVRNREEARVWHERAIKLAQRSTHESSRREAIAWDHLATTCMDSECFDEAVLAAKRARECWYRHDAGAVSAARADLNLASSLLRHGESLVERDSGAARPVLSEAMEWLNRAEQELLPYGPTCGAEARLCREQKDFARRLLASLAP